MRPRTFFVYILASPTGTLYVGITNQLARRLTEHRSGEGGSFTARYGVTKLVYAESCGNVHDAIAREKQLKSWCRAKKVALVEAINPRWEDLPPPE